ncbi:Cro/CI family transcriptional regulator [Alteromonas mediterranea]|uniref:Cro/CI family transcriptional regulator n=1 Tax=Alteromonas mediterranea TaxID=314275 RepID=UPI000C68E5C0|nr:Cro/CI family transcriptional regulator [Alteromonas mediterranea]MBB66872.1 Cro/Cl family transcriptional regulator [Rickettsiales bacterium]
MKKSDAIEHFGSASKLASAINVAPSAVSQWGETIPLLRAYQLEKITGGKLKVEEVELSKAS